MAKETVYLEDLNEVFDEEINSISESMILEARQYTETDKIEFKNNYQRFLFGRNLLINLQNKITNG